MVCDAWPVVKLRSSVALPVTEQYYCLLAGTHFSFCSGQEADLAGVTGYIPGWHTGERSPVSVLSWRRPAWRSGLRSSSYERS